MHPILEKILLYSIIIFFGSCSGKDSTENKEKIQRTTVIIQAGDALSSLGENAYSYLIRDQKNGLGGIKLCYELSADLNDVKNSNLIQIGDEFTFYTPEELTLNKRGNQEEVLSSLIYSDIITYNWGKTIGFFELLLSALEPGLIHMNISITNKSKSNLNFSIKKGDLFETKYPKNNPQNIVISTSQKIQLNPNETKKIRLRGFCTNINKSLPIGEIIIPTIFFLDANLFNSQKEVWNHFKTLKTKLKSQEI